MTNPMLLLTGAGGFVGRHVLAATGIDGALAGWNVVALPKACDIRDGAALNDHLGRLRPDAVLHLAAQSFVPRSFEHPWETFEINLGGTLNLLSALAGCGFSGRMIYVSSGDVYGHVPEEALPVDESRLPEPRSPYAVSKLAAEQLCLQWHRTDGLDVMIARPFNHVGPGQDDRFVLPSLARQIVDIAAGRAPPVIEAGDIDTTRDFTDVRDVVAAYGAMFANGSPGATYVIGSGEERAVRTLFETMCEMQGVEPEIRQDPARIRPAEQRRMAADSSLLRLHTGWIPRIPFDTTLNDILEEATNRND